MGKRKPTVMDIENLSAAWKSKNKGIVIDEGEYPTSPELSEESQIMEKKATNPGKKREKGNWNALQTKKDDEYDLEEVEEDDDASGMVIEGKKKSKFKEGGASSIFSAANFGLFLEEDNVYVLAGDNASNGEDDELASFKGKEKSSRNKGNKGSGILFCASAFDTIPDDNTGDRIDKGEDNEDDDEPVIFKGKKKSSKHSTKGGSEFSAARVDELHGVKGNDVWKEEKKNVKDDEGDEPITAALLDEDRDTTLITVSAKKKGISFYAGLSPEAEVEGENVHTGETEQLNMADSKVEPVHNIVNRTQKVAETLKNKKKKKKSGRTAQEEVELGKILAELGEGPPTLEASDLPFQEEKVRIPAESVLSEDVAGEKECEEEMVESALAKKKKKKRQKEKEKEKEKEKKAAAAEGMKEKQEEVKAETTEPKRSGVKGKAVDKKVLNRVRGMQEALARRKEAEEGKKREEEKRLRKEEEERCRQEELERLAEEARQRKKEREKEKLLKKKLEGKPITANQKEAARCLEARRNQILASAGVPLHSADKEGAPSKRPKYQTKKSKPSHQHANGSAFASGKANMEEKEKQKDKKIFVAEGDQTESEKVEDVELVVVEDEQRVSITVKDYGMEEDDNDDIEEWDAKSWDNVNLNVNNPFDDEVSEPNAVVKREFKNCTPADGAAAKKVLPLQEDESQSTEIMESQPEIEVTDKTKRTDVDEKNKAPTSDATVKQGDKNLRSPICCVMGHVDTGKTKLLDCIRGTNIREGEAGGITQQIGATYFPAEDIQERTKELKADANLKVPGLLVIDTPGHESFTNLRSRGSSLCDIAILVVDIMHGLEPQTLESLGLLKSKNAEFIVSLNKVDKLYGWKTCRNAPIVKAMKQQTKDVQNEFNRRLSEIIFQFKMEGLNTELYYKNRDMGETFSIVPTSAISGEGIPDLLLLLVQWTQRTMVEKLTFSDVVQCTVLEVKVAEGHGTTIDVVLVNGVLHEGDRIVVCGLQGPIVTTIRALLTPHPMKELRVKGTYLHHKEIKAAQGIKITAQGLEHAIVGTELYVIGPSDNLETLKEAAMEEMRSVMNWIDKSGEGVYVQASTLGSLEALLVFLKTDEIKIPVSGVSIGPVHKKDVMRASVMLEKKKEYATILAFDVKVTPEAQGLAEALGVKILVADVIYHLFDQFKSYIDHSKEEKKREVSDETVFPCLLKILPNCIFNKKDPILLGVDILAGMAKVGAPICVPKQDFIDIGRIASIEINKKAVDYAKKGQTVAIKIVGTNPEEQQKMYGRHFGSDDELVTRISRRSIDILRTNYREELTKEDVRLLKRLKNLFGIS